MRNDQLAALLQREFESLRTEMVNRDEFHASEVKLLHAIDALGSQLSEFSVRVSSDFQRLSD